MLFAGCALASAARDGARSERAGSLWELASLRRGVELVQPRELLRFLRPPPPAALTWLLLKVDARKLISRLCQKYPPLEYSSSSAAFST